MVNFFKSSWAYPTLFFVLFLYTPRIHFFQVPGSTSDLRLDIVLMMFFGFAYIFANLNIFINNRRKMLFWYSFIILSYVSLVFILVSNNIFYAGFQIFWYMTMIFSFFLAKDLLDNFSTDKSVSFLRIFVNINALMHLTDTINWRIFGNERLWELAYGFFEIPSPFTLVVGGYTTFVLLRGVSISRVEKIILISAVLFSESRIGTGAFFLTMIIFSRYRVWVFFTAILLYIAQFFINAHLKSLSFLTLTFDKLLQDPSLLMRVGNMNAMVDWWQVSGSLWFGGGVLSHLEYSSQFGKPGPLDSFYLKMLSDFGVISFILMIFLIVFLFAKKRYLIKLNFRSIMSIIVFISIYSVLNEGLVSIKSGHIIFFLIGIAYWETVKNRKKNGLIYFNKPKTT